MRADAHEGRTRVIDGLPPGPPGQVTYLRWRFALMVTLTLLAGSYLIVQFYHLAARFGDVVSLYFGAWILHFLLEPPVEWLCARGWRRGLAAFAVYAAVLLALIGILAWTFPIFITQLRDLAAGQVAKLSRQDVPSLSAQVQRFIHRHAPPTTQPLLIDAVKNFSAQIQSQLDKFSSDVVSSVQSLTTTVAIRTFNLLDATLTLLFRTFIVIILSFFMTLYGGQVRQALYDYLPIALHPDLAAMQNVIDRAFGGFVRGQLLLSALYGALLFAIMQVFAQFIGGGDELAGFSVAGAILAAIIMIIPLVGTTLSMAPPVIIGIFTLQNTAHVVWLLLAVWVVQLCVSNIAGPRVMSQAVGINPLWTFAGLLVGGKLGGILGAFFSVPMLAVALAALDRLYLHLLHRDPNGTQGGTCRAPARVTDHAAALGKGISALGRLRNRHKSPARRD